MSAITSVDYSQGPDSIYRYRTRVRCVLHSHTSSQPIDISDSIINFNTAKAIKSTGHLAIALKANQNWLNQIYPNDYINLYVDRGDGFGFTRLFFGFVDNIAQKITTAENGVPNTVFSLACSDFQKAFEKTQIYFNPNLALRADFRNSDIAATSPTVFMTNAGIAGQAAPSDFVLMLLIVLFGFGTQFTLPTCYNPNVVSTNRAARADFLLGILSADTRSRVLNTGYRTYLENLRQQAGLQTPLDALTDPTSANASDIQQRERTAFSAAVATDLAGSSDTTRGLFVYNALNTTLAGYPPSLLDIMDIHTYLERKAMDGYIVGQPWEEHPDVLSYARSVANEIVNELFFDLRLVSSGGGLVDGEYFSTDNDDVGGNEATSMTSPGLQYVPALVMREYPFGTIAEINGESVNLDFQQEGQPTGPVTALGRVPVGALFSDQPNLAGRHVVTIPNINAADLAAGQTTSRASKHLDVAVVYAGEIVNSELSRGDGDIFNLLSVMTDYMSQDGSIVFLLAALPLVTPVSIARHGLRTRVLQTRAAMAVPRIVNHIQAQTAPQDEPEQQTAPDVVETPGTSRFPIDLVADASGTYTQGHIRGEGGEYGYRYRTNTSGDTAAFNGQRGVVPEGDAIWRMHNGVDLVAATGTPVYAVRDGWVMAAALADNINTTPGSPNYGKGSGGTDGTGAVQPFGGYGSAIIIYHPEDPSYRPSGSVPVGSVFTVYAHLLSIESNLLQGNSVNGNTRFAPELRSGGRYQPYQVRAGDLIGHVGRTGVRNMGAHLHFEVLVKQAHRADGHGYVWPSKDNTANPDLIHTATQQQPTGWAPSTARIWPAPPGAEPPVTSVSCTSQEPSAYLTRWVGTALPRGTDTASGDDPTNAYPGDADEHNPPPEVAPAPVQEVEDSQTDEPDGQQGYVSAAAIRYWLVRWALLNDHWYQHNIEYLAGSIEMRGAPEIRVAYRLDVVEWNMSFYVENVSHSWQYGERMVTSLQVSRGQPNNPYPAYVLPSSPSFSPTDTQRITNSRLAQFFTVVDPLAVKRSLNIETSSGHNHYVNPSSARGSTINDVDSPGESGSLSDRYNENILEAQSISVDPTAESSTGASGPLATTIADPSLTGTSVQAGATDLPQSLPSTGIGVA